MEENNITTPEGKTFTQEEVNGLIKERLDRAEKKWAEKYSNYSSPEDITSKTEELNKQIATLTEALETEKGKTADSTQTIGELKDKINSYEVKEMKLRIASEYGLPVELASRLSGQSEEEYRKDAESLKKFCAVREMPMYNPESGPVKSGTDKAFLDMLSDLSSKGR